MIRASLWLGRLLELISRPFVSDTCLKKWKSDLEGLGGRRTGTREQVSLSFHVIATIAEKKLSDHSD